ncbi:MAG: periplasmic heavy metal sensor [Gemmatimonadales bacterium]|nr:periplasmic heavy metal sensor [Gemmatimonadales bacterium]
MTKSKLSAVALLIAAFVLGALTGGAALALADRGSDAGPKRGGKTSFIERLDRDLGLSAEQRESVELILEQHRPRMDSLWREVAPRFETLRAEVRSELNTILTPEQQVKHQEMMERRAERHRQNGKHNAP